MKRVLAVIIAILAVDVVAIIVTGNISPLAAGGSVGPLGFGLRLLVLGGSILAGCLPGIRRRPRGFLGRLVLVMLLLPTLFQFQLMGGRLSGVDSISYYVFLRSMLKDRDFNLVNEYDHYGMLSRPDLAVTTKTGHRRSIYSVGPAVVWTPFFLAGEATARLQGWLSGGPVDLTGYGTHHRNAVALGSVLYGFATLLLIHGLLTRHFSGGLALGAVLLLWGATFYHYYLVIQPTYAHSASTCCAAYVLWLWDRDRGKRTLWGNFYLGMILGLSMCVRWQNGVLLLLPGLDLVRSFWSDRRLDRLFKGSGLLLLGTFAGAFPQMAAWKALYNMWILPYPPQGTDFMRFDHPWILETLFSSRHGLLSWTPVFWLGYLGLIPLLRRKTGLAVSLLPVLLLMTYVNMCVGDYWGGASFSNRRFDSCLPILAFGFAGGLEVLRNALACRPQVVLALIAIPFTAWNLMLAEQTRRGMIPRDDTVSFPRLAGNAARVVSDSIGFPTTWPASWLFALRFGRPPSQYEAVGGRYLFYRQNSLGGRLELGAPDDERLLGNGWSGIEIREGEKARRVRGRAFVLAPLDVPEEIEVRVRALADPAHQTRLLINGREAGAFLVAPAWSEYRLLVPRDFWRRELNQVSFEVEGGEISVDWVLFTRQNPRKR